jgi:competence protein ComEC
MGVGLASPMADRLPDVLVSADGRLIAVRTQQGAFLQMTQGGAKFTRDAWLQYWSLESFHKIPSGTGTGTGTGPSAVRTDDGGERPAIHCEPGFCLLRPYPDRPGALLARGGEHPKFCDQASVIVSAEPARGLCPKPWPKLVDRFTVWRYGSTAIWLDKGRARMLTDRRERGVRPWVAPLPKPRKPAAPTLPPAAVDRPVRDGQAASVPNPLALLTGREE